MKQPIKIGFTDYSVLLFLPDPASTDGSGKTGLVAANLTVSYTRVETDNDVAVTDVTSSLNNLAALTTAHTDWGLLEVSNTLAPGLYRLDIADAVFASGAWTAVVYVMITTSAAAASPMEFVLVAYDMLDGVRLGLTALPPAAADAAGGLPISAAGGLPLDDLLVLLDDIGERLGALVIANGLVGSTGNDTTHVQLDGLTYADGQIVNYLLTINDVSASEIHLRFITGWVNATQLATVATLPFTPEDGVDEYTLLAVRQDLAVASVTGAVGSVTGFTAADIATILTRLSPIATKTGTVVTDGGNSATSFKTDLTAPGTDHYKDAFVKLTSGTLINQVKKCTGSTGTTGVVLTFTSGFTATPADGVTLEIVND